MTQGSRIAKVISIHAPTRGATRSVCGVASPIPDFNPRSHERSDGKCGLFLGVISHFNPRSHERSDAKSGAKGMHPRYFNPRSHERSDRVRRYWRAFCG